MLKRILVPLDPSPFTQVATETACRIAKRLGAEITGLVVLDLPGIQKAIGPIPLGGAHYAKRLEGLKRSEAAARIESLMSSFDATCKAAGVSHREAEAQGSPCERIIQESIYYDIIVMGLRTFFHFESRAGPGDTLDKVLDRSITPVLGVPEVLPSLDPESPIKYLIPFNASLPSARALQRFAEVALPERSEVTLLMSDSEEEAARYHLEQAKTYLACHGFSAIRTEWTAEEIIGVVDRRYLDTTDLVVVGAHSKRTLKRFMVGSLVKYLIKEARKPVWIGQ